MLKTRGIIFKQTKYRDTSVILDIYTEEVGLQTFIMNGVFTKGNQRTASLLQLMQLTHLEVYFQEGKNMHRIKEVNSAHIYQRIPFEINYSATGTFMIEICRKLFKEQGDSHRIFQFIYDQFTGLDEMDHFDPMFHLYFLKNCCDILGFIPLPNYTEQNNVFDLINACYVPEQRENIETCNSKDSFLFYQFLIGNKKNLQRNERQISLHILLQFLERHVDHFGKLQSIDVFKSIF